MKFVLLTSNLKRHLFLSKKIKDSFPNDSVITFLEEKNQQYNEDTLTQFHFKQLDLEIDKICDCIDTHEKCLLVNRGHFKDSAFIDSIKLLKPDLIITYGCGIISNELLNLNIPCIGSHQGLPQYYRGSGSNFFAFINKDLTRMGVSIHILDSGIDTGDIIRQEHIVPSRDETYYSYSAKLIKATVENYCEAVNNFRNTRQITGKSLANKGILYQRKDLSFEMIYRCIQMQTQKSFYGWYKYSLNRNGKCRLMK